MTRLSIPIGTRIGAYEITGPLGVGGMGEVYRAHDPELRRDVALKLLPAAVAGHADRLARFRREAQLLAALNHPNVAQVYGIEHTDALPPVIVMELVPGRTLDDVLRDSVPAGMTGLPLADVVSIARQMAAALEAAHESGIVHRDLKPANVKLRNDGVVKVLDFGLAKVLEPDLGSRGASPATFDSPTLTSPAMTEMGVILGTAAYMAPEQARGRPVDKRADIWAYGAVVFELLSGEPLFASSGSVTDTIAAVIKDDLRLHRLPADTPPRLRMLVERCLERDPAERLRDIGEARILLSRPLEPAVAPAGTVPSSSPTRRRWAAAGAIALLAVALAAAAWVLQPAAPATSPRRLDLAVPSGLASFAISNDGTRVAYLASHTLYVRRFDEFTARSLGVMHVTASDLAWAPDDRAIAFVAESKIHTIPAAGGRPFVVTEVPASGRVMGLAWLPNDTLAFSVWRDSLYAVPSAGGAADVLLAVDAAAEIDFHQVAAAPGKRLHVSTHRRPEEAEVVELNALSGDRRRTTLTRDPNVRAFTYIPAGGGRVLFVREGTNAGVWVVPFTEGAVDFQSATLLVPEATRFGVALDGTVLAAIPARQRQALVWVDATGAETAVAGDPVDGPLADLALSPDGRRAAFVQGLAREAGTLVVRDLQTGIDTKLSLAQGDDTWGAIGRPAWSPDGQRLVHRTGRVEGAMLVDRRADVAATARPLTSGMMGRWLPDRSTLIYIRDERGIGRLERAVLDAQGRVGPAQPLMPEGHELNVSDFDVSGDGRLIAVAARQQGPRSDLFVAEIANPGEQWLVQEGATRPRFTRDARALYYIRGVADAQGRPQGQLVRRPIVRAPTISFGPPELLLLDREGGPRVSSFDLAPDGRRVLMDRPVPPAPDDGERLVLIEGRALQP